MKHIEDFLNFPEDSIRNKKIFKEKIYNHMNINNRDKKIFIDNIQEIKWLFSLKEENIKILPFDNDKRRYVEVEIINIILKDNKGINRIADIMFRYLYHPTVLIIEYKNEISFFAAHKVKHGSDSNKSIIEGTMTDTEWIDLENQDNIDKILFDSLKIENLKSTNLYTFYDKIIENILVYNISKKIGKSILINPNYTLEETKQFFEKYKTNEKEIETVNKKFNKKLSPKKIFEYNNKIKDLKNEQKELMEIWA